MKGRVFIIGLGLIGGSLALCIKGKHPESDIIGFDVDEHQVELAKTLGVIDDRAASIDEGARDADLIIIATPVANAEKIIELLADAELKKDVIVTDTGSTKGYITKKASCLIEKDIIFIGGHPDRKSVV